MNLNLNNKYNYLKRLLKIIIKYYIMVKQYDLLKSVYRLLEFQNDNIYNTIDLHHLNEAKIYTKLFDQNVTKIKHIKINTLKSFVKNLDYNQTN